MCYAPIRYRGIPNCRRLEIGPSSNSEFGSSGALHRPRTQEHAPFEASLHPQHPPRLCSTFPLLPRSPRSTDDVLLSCFQALRPARAARPRITVYEHGRTMTRRGHRHISIFLQLAKTRGSRSKMSLAHGLVSRKLLLRVWADLQFGIRQH